MKTEEWSAFGTAWQIDEPFWGALFAALPRVHDEAVHTVALKPLGNNALQLAHPRDWLMRVSESQGRNEIRHELMHLLLGHPFQATEKTLHYFYSLACDLNVQQFFFKENCNDMPFPLTDFPELSENQKLSATESACMLQALWRKDIQFREEKMRWNRLEIFARAALEHHIYWPEINRNTTALLPWYQHWKQDALRRNHDENQELSAFLQEKTENIALTGSSLAWRHLLQRFIAHAGNTFIKNTVHRPSRRFGIRPGIKICSAPQIWIAVDTSASVSSTDLSLFFQTLETVYRRGMNLTVLECDTVIRRRYPFTGKAPREIAGRGDTRWEPVLQAATRERPDGLVFFTDGRSNLPEKSCTTPVLWMIAPDGISQGAGIWNSLPGRVVKMM